MIVLMWMVVGAIVVGMAVYLVYARRSVELPDELESDWWPQFESEFRAYARLWESTRGRQANGSAHKRNKRSTRHRNLAEGSF